MAYYVGPLENLINKVRSLPGIGTKSAQRLAFHILSLPEKEAEDFANAVLNAKKSIHYCKECQNLTDREKCSICENPKRDRSVICVVESPSDVIAIEKTKEYKGLYHVLHGVISPMENIGPADIKIKELLYRLQDEDIKEVIIATNPTVEGDATAMYISKLLKSLGVTSSRLAFGLPIGGDLEYADELTLSKAIENRRIFDN